MNGLSEEQIYEIVLFLEMNLNHIVCAFFIWKLCKAFLAGKNKKENHLLWLVPLSYYAVLTILQVIPVVMESLFVYFVSIFAVFLCMLLVSKEYILVKIFLCITFYSIRFHISSMVNMLCIPLFNLVSEILNQITDYHYMQVWQWQIIHIAINALINLLFVSLAFSYVINCIIQNFPFQNKKLSGREMLFLLTPAISGCLCYLMIHWIFQEVDLIYGKIFFQKYPYLNFMIFLLCFMTLVSTLVVIILLKNLEKKKEEEKRQEVLEHQIKEFRSHIGEIEQLYSGIQSMKHDIKNHITVMEELIVQKKYAEAQTFLSSMEKSVGRLDYIYITGHPVTDVIINEKYQRAKKKAISFKSKFYFPEGLSLDVFDVSIILNNALENALEALEKEFLKGKKELEIVVSSICRKQMYLIEVKNSFSGIVEWDKEGSLPKSSKKYASFHGIGLKNIRKVAEKYKGDIDIEIENGYFILTVILKL